MFYNKKSAAPDVEEGHEADVLTTESVRDLANTLSSKRSSGLLSEHYHTKVEPTVISAGAVFTGNIKSPGPIHTQGVVEGDIDAPRVTLGVKGKAVGKITCQQLVIEGSFSGDLDCQEVTAGKTASLQGNISCETLTVAPGAAVNGDLRVGKR